MSAIETLSGLNLASPEVVIFRAYGNLSARQKSALLYALSVLSRSGYFFFLVMSNKRLSDIPYEGYKRVEIPIDPAGSQKLRRP